MQGSCATPRWFRLERGGPFTVPRPWPGPGVHRASKGPGDHIGARQVGRSLPGRVPSRQEGRYSLTQAGWCLWDVVPAVSSQPFPLPRGPPVCCIESRRREQPRRKGAPRPPQRAPARLPALLRLGPKRLGVRTRRAGARGRRVRIPRRRWGGRRGRGNRELLVNGYKVSFLQNESVLEISYNVPIHNIPVGLMLKVFNTINLKKIKTFLKTKEI